MDLSELDNKPVKVARTISPEEDRELGILILRRDFYEEKGLDDRIKELEDKNVRDKEE